MKYFSLLTLAAVLVLACNGTDECLGINDLEVTAYQCADSIDNDGDGLTDCDDEDCKLFIFCDGETDTDSESETETDTEPDAGDLDGGTDLDGGKP